MEWIEAFLLAIGLKLKTVIASAFGAFISLRFFDNLSWWERWLVVLGGWAMGSYLAEGLAYWLGVASHPSLELGLGLWVAIFGMACVSALMKVIRETDWPGIIKSVLSFRFGGGGK